MNPQTTVAVSAIVASAAVAVIVPWLTFRLALRQEQRRWLREQRAQLYVDMLTEAHADQQWLTYELADEKDRDAIRQRGDADLRLTPADRARLAARANAFAAGPVITAYNELQSATVRAGVFQKEFGPPVFSKEDIDALRDKLHKAVRDDLNRR